MRYIFHTIIPAITIAVWFILVLMAALPAQAQGPYRSCNERTKILTAAANNYQEAIVAVGVTFDNKLIEVLSAPENGTWTLIITNSKGYSCLIATGEGWHQLVAKIPGDDT